MEMPLDGSDRDDIRKDHCPRSPSSSARSVSLPTPVVVIGCYSPAFLGRLSFPVPGKRDAQQESGTGKAGQVRY